MLSSSNSLVSLSLSKAIRTLNLSVPREDLDLPPELRSEDFSIASSSKASASSYWARIHSHLAFSFLVLARWTILDEDEPPLEAREAVSSDLCLCNSLSGDSSLLRARAAGAAGKALLGIGLVTPSLPLDVVAVTPREDSGVPCGENPVC